MYTNFDDFDKYVFPEAVDHRGHLIGNNQKSILVLCLENKLGETNLDLLKKILKAKNIDLNDDALLLTIEEDAEINISRLIREEKIKHLFVFGIHAKQIGINVQWKLYQKFTLSGVQILISHNLEDLSSNQAFKKNLWNQLKTWEF